MKTLVKALGMSALAIAFGISVAYAAGTATDFLQLGWQSDDGTTPTGNIEFFNGDGYIGTEDSAAYLKFVNTSSGGIAMMSADARHNLSTTNNQSQLQTSTGAFAMARQDSSPGAYGSGRIWLHGDWGVNNAEFLIDTNGNAYLRGHNGSYVQALGNGDALLKSSKNSSVRANSSGSISMWSTDGTNVNNVQGEVECASDGSVRMRSSDGAATPSAQSSIECTNNGDVIITLGS
ncbi:MAG: hypothetical protein HYV27_08515 [Candidatus Hydrogenedentes bacterium]|nr:hypothetical protein [Candidatus Hydrogenedentota bacterium]